MRIVIVREVRRTTPRTWLVRVDLGEAPFVFRAGQAVKAGRRGASSLAPYSIASAPSAASQGELDLLVSADHTFGERLDIAGLAGSALEMSRPFGEFGVPDRSGFAPLLCVAGGTGIAPIRAVVRDTIERQPGRPLTLLYSVRSLDEFAFDDEFDALRADGRLAYHKTVTREDATEWEGRLGRVDRSQLSQVWPGRAAWSLVCGPPEFVGAVSGGLLEVGADPERIIVER